jgi:hypothetical protein
LVQRGERGRQFGLVESNLEAQGVADSRLVASLALGKKVSPAVTGASIRSQCSIVSNVAQPFNVTCSVASCDLKATNSSARRRASYSPRNAPTRMRTAAYTQLPSQ